MFGRKNKISLRFKLVVIASLVLAICLLGLIGVYGKTTIWRGSASRAARPAESSAQAQQPVPIIASYFTPASLPIRIAAAAASNDKGATGLSYTITNIGSGEVSGIDLALFDFNPTGGLMKVQVWNLQTSLAAGKSANYSLGLKSPATAASRLILSAEAVRADADISRNTAASWHVDFLDLAQTIAGLAVGGKDTGLQSTQRTAAIPELSGSAYCSDAFAKAFQLSKLSDGKALSAFTCDRTRRSFVFGFNNKSLVQK
jgi:hypothetical protein